jgi:hypothetical protein
MTGAASDNPERRLLVWNARHSGILIEFEHILICRVNDAPANPDATRRDGRVPA